MWRGYPRVSSNRNRMLLLLFVVLHLVLPCYALTQCKNTDYFGEKDPNNEKNEDTTVGTERTETFTIPTNERYLVKADDVTGWYSAGQPMILYDGGGGGGGGGGRRDRNRLWELMGSQLVGYTDYWTPSATLTDKSNRDYGVRLNVEPSAIPKFGTNLDASKPIQYGSTIGTPVSLITVAATDTDLADVLTYTWVEKPGFTFNVTTKILKTATLDPEPKEYEIIFYAADQCLQTVTGTHTVTITNASPEFADTPAAVAISVDLTSRTLVYNITCTDDTEVPQVDFHPTTKGLGYQFVIQQIPYSIPAAYAVYTTVDPKFVITEGPFVLLMNCTDGYSTVTDRVTVILTPNGRPSIENLQGATSLSVNSSIGHVVYILNATDPEGDQLNFTYYFTYYSSACESPAPFVVTAAGEVLLNSSIVNTTCVAWDLYICVMDPKHTDCLDYSILTITITDHNHPVYITNLPLASAQPISEATPVGARVYTVSISDVDVNQTHVYKLEPENKYFKIDSLTGAVTLKEPLDYEALSPADRIQTLEITVSDGDSSDTQILKFNITDGPDPPVFSQSAYSMSCNEGAAGTLCYCQDYNVIEKDVGDTLTYTADCGAYTGLFHINTSTACVKFQSLYDMDDVEHPPPSNPVACTLTVTDSAGASDTADLNITVFNINDNTPLFVPGAYGMFVSLYAGVGHTIDTVTATDGDAGTFGDFTYSLTHPAGLTAEYFGINSDGEVYLLEPMSKLNLVGGVTMTLTVSATDTGGAVGYAVITMTVGDTTTTSTTTTTDRFLTWSEDPRNIVVLVFTCITLVALAAWMGYIVYTCRGPNSCANVCRFVCRSCKCCKRGGYRTRRRRRRVSTPESSHSPVSYVRTATPPRVRHDPVTPYHPPTAPMPRRFEVTEKAPPTAAGEFNFWREKDFQNGIVGFCSNTHFGENDPNSKDNSIDSNSGFGYLMSETNYIIDCCGVVDGWEAELQVSGTKTISYQIWRQTTGDTYTLVGENVYTTSSDGEQTTSITQNNRITVLPDDKWGWWTSGTDLVRHKDGGSEENDNWYMAMADQSTGDTHDWSTRTTKHDRSYGIRVNVLTNNDPTFSNLPASTSITNGESSGTSLITLTVIDVDTYDISSLSVSFVANSKFSYNTGTKVLSTGNVGGASSTELLVFKVTDQCDNTGTGTYTVTITNEPPVIQNLPSSADLSEDTTVETKLFTINATDSVDTPTCDLAASTPAAYPFFVRLIVSTTDYGIYSSSSPGFDYDTLNNYVLTVECTDGDNTATGTFTVFLLENTAPVFQNLQGATSVSTTTTTGTNVFTVNTTDAEGDQLTYTMTCNPVACPFAIFASGAIQLNQDLTGHTTVGYDLSITVSDGRNTVGPGLLTITITGNVVAVQWNLTTPDTLGGPQGVRFGEIPL